MHNDDFKKGARGEFRGDFTRDTFDPYRNFSRVLMQQGRVQLDSDWNEQVSIINHYLRTLTTDLIGPHGAPPGSDGEPGKGFEISAPDKILQIHHGHYYVGGILCQNNASEEGLLYTEQPDYPLTSEEKITTPPDGQHLVYLDVWERHLSYVEDDYMREKALGGPDTATRAKIVWQVKIREVSENADIGKSMPYNIFLENLKEDIKPGTGQLKARAKTSAEDNSDPCLIAPKASYRGAENQLYRVEIHKNGEAGGGGATFKWSRENGSVIFPIAEFDGGDVITLEHLGRDCRFGLKPNDWVELVDDDYILHNLAAPLLKIKEVDTANSQVILQSPPQTPVATDPGKHPYLRRWDQTKGGTYGVPVNEGDGDSDWIALEDGVEVQFPTPGSHGSENEHVYQTGDFWLIPARTATGDVEWPGLVDDPGALPPQGVDHHYAPLALINVNSDGAEVVDLRRIIKSFW